MEKNIFEGAEFGDKFITKDGLLYASYICEEFIDLSNGSSILTHKLYIQVFGIHNIMPDGRVIFKNGDIGHDSMDIVSRYQVPINEEKLDEIAHMYAKNVIPRSITFPRSTTFDISEAYKAGYNKAKEVFGL